MAIVKFIGGPLDGAEYTFDELPRVHQMVFPITASQNMTDEPYYACYRVEGDRLFYVNTKSKEQLTNTNKKF